MRNFALAIDAVAGLNAPLSAGHFFGCIGGAKAGGGGS